MGILSWIIVGLIAGWLAGELMRGSGFGLVGNIIVGIVGGLLGGFLASALFNIPDPMSGINITSLIIAFLGAVLLLAILRLFRRSRV
ncbi:MAG: GlsB/YeaQ/YmgE family stress response membrane protein [Chloroflexi bacterium]|nr:GlsB/YeaQ/YmgE family stress response membrane protein [Chloroflexota bacterium]